MAKLNVPAGEEYGDTKIRHCIAEHSPTYAISIVRAVKFCDNYEAVKLYLSLTRFKVDSPNVIT